MAALKTKFYCFGNPPPRQAQTHFRKKRDKYEFRSDGKGNKILTLVGETDIYDSIQQYADDCDVYKILKRVSMGDLSLLEKRQGQYVDAVGLPMTLQESFNFVFKAKDDFDNLPAEIREKFDNDVVKFAAATSDDIAKVIAELKGKQVVPEKKIEQSEVKEDVTEK